MRNAMNRDLAENWDVDISTELQEYLDELDVKASKSTSPANINFAEGITKQLNSFLILFSFPFPFPFQSQFSILMHVLLCASAALLIQGSASVYSKKVEYLYSLLYNTVDLVCPK
jgi:condensin-2 complex subunit H2